MQETWKDIEGYEGIYQISTFGRVKALAKVVNYIDGRKRKYKELLLNLNRTDGHGYSAVSFYKEGIVTQLRVHRLVAQAFLPNPLNLPCVNHKDGNPKNNYVNNLEWCTYSENTLDGIKRGSIYKPAKKINIDIVNDIKNTYATGNYSQEKVGKMFGLSQTQIFRIVNNINWVV